MGLCVPACVAALLVATTREDLAEAARLLQSTHDEAALQVASRALDRDDVSLSQRAELYVLLGTARFNLRDEEGAKLAYERALQADFQVVPGLSSPTARDLFERTRAEVAQQRARAPAAPRWSDSPAPRTLAPGGSLSAEPQPGMRRWVGLLLVVVGATAGSIGGDLLGAAYGQRALAMAAPDALRADLAYRRSILTRDEGLVLIGAGAAVLVAGVVVALWPSTRSVSLALGTSGNSVLVSGRF